MTLPRVASLASLCLIVSGCESEPAPPAHSVATETRENGVEVTTTTFATESGTVTLQSRDGDVGDLPLGLPLFPDAAVVSSATFVKGRTRTHFLELASDAEPAQITAFYEAVADGAGMVMERGLPAGDAPMLHATGDGGAHLTLTTKRQPDGPVIAQLTVTEPR